MTACTHADAVPVTSAGQTVAALCPTCDTQLPAEWLTCEHPESVDISEITDRHRRLMCLGPCGATYWEVR